MSNNTESYNHINHLQGIRRDSFALADRCTSELIELISYLESDKFHNDTTVQVKDVMRRLAPALSTLGDIREICRHGSRTRAHDISCD
jgi:hypothetical protein